MRGRILSVYLDGVTATRLRKTAEETGRSMEDLAECAVSESLLYSWRHRKDDPGKKDDAA
jgi:hypothetical protein